MNTVKTLLLSFSFLWWIANPAGAALWKPNQTQVYFPHNRSLLLGNAGIWPRCASAPLYLCFFQKNTLNSPEQPTITPPQPIEINDKTRKSLNIKLEPILEQNLNPELTTIGQTEGQTSQLTNVSLPNSGTIVTLMVNLGDSVKQGQTIAVVSRPKILTQPILASEAQSQLLAAQERLQQAQANYQLQQSLAQAKVIENQLEVVEIQQQSKQDQILDTQFSYISTQASYQQTLLNPDIYAAKQELEEAQSALAAAKNRLKLTEVAVNSAASNSHPPEYVPIVAPVSGKVTHLDLTYGESIVATDSPMVTIAKYEQIWLITAIKAEDYPLIHLGQEVKVKVPQFPHQSFTGKIQEIAAQLVGKSAQIPLRVQLNNPNGQLQPGMSATVEILTGETAQNRLLIPKKAIIAVNNQNWIYRKSGLNSYQPVKVSLGETIGSLVEVEGDLWTEDQVITEGANRLYNYSLEPKSKNELVLWLIWLGLGGGMIRLIVKFKIN
jgi:RND family efflux transporter MFP subunit